MCRWVSGGRGGQVVAKLLSEGSPGTQSSHSHRSRIGRGTTIEPRRELVAGGIHAPEWQEMPLTTCAQSISGYNNNGNEEPWNVGNEQREWREEVQPPWDSHLQEPKLQPTSGTSLQGPEGETAPPELDPSQVPADDLDLYGTIQLEDLDLLVNTFTPPASGAGQPSSPRPAPEPAHTNQGQAPTAPATSPEPHPIVIAFQQRVTGLQERLADRVDVGLQRLTDDIAGLRGCLTSLVELMQQLLDTHSPFHALQRYMGDIAGVMIQRQQSLAAQGGSRSVSVDLAKIRESLESMERMQAQDLAARAAHMDRVARIFEAQNLLMASLLPHGLAQMDAAAASTSSAPESGVSVPHSAAHTTPTAPSEAHDTEDEGEEEEMAFPVRKRR